MPHDKTLDPKQMLNISSDNSELFEKLPPDAFDFVNIGTVIQDQKFETKPIGYFRDAMTRFVKNRASIVAFIIIFLIVAMSFIGPAVSGYTYRGQIISAGNLPPRIKFLEKYGIFNGTKVMRIQKTSIETTYKDSYISTIREYEQSGVTMVEVRVNAYILSGHGEKYFWFGTDNLGRDLFTRTFYGVRISLLISTVAVLINWAIGITYGAISGYYGGKVDLVMQRITEVLSGLPNIVVLTLCIMYLGNTSIFTIIISFCLTGWIGSSHTTRVQFYRYKNREFVLAANTMGASDKRIIIKHILPSCVGTMITRFALTIPGHILSEAGLAYLGMGLQAPMPSLGVLCQDGQQNLTSYPYKIVAPALIISLLMICFNLMGNGLRDAFNPTLRGA